MLRSFLNKNFVDVEDGHTLHLVARQPPPTAGVGSSTVNAEGLFLRPFSSVDIKTVRPAVSDTSLNPRSTYVDVQVLSHLFGFWSCFVTTSLPMLSYNFVRFF